MNNIKIQAITVGAVQTNSYLIYNTENSEAILIDPGAEATKILHEIGEKELTLKGILLTHGHFDHILGVKGILDKIKIPVYACRLEEELLKDNRMNCSLMFGTDVTLTPDVLLDDKEILTIAGMNIEVIYTPGHTKGSVCYYLKDAKILVSGDTLFFESVGRTDLPTGNEMQLLISIREQLFILPEDVNVYPGHGIHTSIGYEKKNNPCM